MTKVICVEDTRFVELGILNMVRRKRIKLIVIIATIYNLTSSLQIRKLRCKDVFMIFKSPT